MGFHYGVLIARRPTENIKTNKLDLQESPLELSDTMPLSPFVSQTYITCISPQSWYSCIASAPLPPAYTLSFLTYAYSFPLFLQVSCKSYPLVVIINWDVYYNPTVWNQNRCQPFCECLDLDNKTSTKIQICIEPFGITCILLADNDYAHTTLINHRHNTTFIYS